MIVGRVKHFYILLIIVVLFFAVSLSGGLSVSHKKDPSDLPLITPQQATLGSGNNIASNKRSLQVGSLGFVTTTPVPTGGVIDFNSVSLDWDDIAQDLQPNLGQVSVTCQQELQQEEYIEDGDIGLNQYGCEKINGTPKSRVALCLRDINCFLYGYNHYHGKTPLPAHIMSPTCQQQIKSALTAVINSNPQGSQVYPDIYSTNCDQSDLICIKTTDYCYSHMN